MYSAPEAGWSAWTDHWSVTGECQWQENVARLARKGPSAYETSCSFTEITISEKTVQQSAERRVSEDNLGARALKSPSQKRLYNKQRKDVSLKTQIGSSCTEIAISEKDCTSNWRSCLWRAFWRLKRVLAGSQLTPSLPWCHLKTTNQSVKSETLKPFLVSFSRWHVKGLSSKCTALKVDVLQGRKIHVFWGVCVYLSAWKFYRLGQWRGYGCLVRLQNM